MAGRVRRCWKSRYKELSVAARNHDGTVYTVASEHNSTTKSMILVERWVHDPSHSASDQDRR